MCGEPPRPAVPSWVSSPSGSYVTISYELADGDDYDDEAVSGKWYCIDYNGEEGFVSASYVTKVAAGDANAKTYELPLGSATTSSYKTNTSTKVYTKPSTLATVVKTLSKGTKVSVSKTIRSGSTYGSLNVSGNWYMIGTNQFVKTDNITKSTSTGKATRYRRGGRYSCCDHHGQSALQALHFGQQTRQDREGQELHPGGGLSGRLDL